MHIQNNKVYRIALTGMLSCLAMIFSYIEMLFPINFIGIPGIKIGFANIVILFALYLMDVKYAVLIELIRVVITGLLFGNLYSIIYSLCGGMFSLLIMILIKKIKKFSICGVSAMGGIFHNIGQLVVAVFTVSEIRLSYYMPFLMLSGLLFGLLNGVVITYVFYHIESGGEHDRIFEGNN